MMKHPVGFRYAKAVFELASEKDTLLQTREDLDLVLQVMKDSSAVDEVFNHPKMTDEKKKEILKDSFSNKISQETLNLLYVLIDNGRMNDLAHVVDNYKGLVNDQQGIAEATVTTAKPISDQEKEAINQVFAKKVGKEKLHIENVVDDAMIGGLKVQIGGRVYDGSITRKLEQIQKKMIHGNV